MDKPKMLSGYQLLVARGLTKASLPELGIKEVTPDGSWLEQKQIQAALEARKHLVEFQRIEKVNSISHAIWKDDLKLAEVTQKVGGHWQYIGHNVGEHLYLTPEETVYLIEINCLLLKHNDVVVSLQKAYHLLLESNVSLIEYEVYSTLSRLGFKIIRHKAPISIAKTVQSGDNDKAEIIQSEWSNELNNGNSSMEVSNNEINDSCTNGTNESLDNRDMDGGNNGSMKMVMEVVSNGNEKVVDEDVVMETNTTDGPENVTANDENNYANGASSSVDGQGFTRLLRNIEDIEVVQTSGSKRKHLKKTILETSAKQKNNNTYQMKLQKLRNRRPKLDPQQTIDVFTNIPDIYKKQTVTINVPEEKYLPRNVFLHNPSYTLNIKDVTEKTTAPTASSSSSTELDLYRRRIRGYSSDNDTRESDISQYDNTPFQQNYSQTQYRPFTFWRPRHHFNYHPFNYQYNMFFPRTFVPGFHFVHPRYRFQQHPFLRQNASTSSTFENQEEINRRHRKRVHQHIKAYHLQAIKNLAVRFKRLSTLPGNINITSLFRLINAFNLKYNERLRLNSDLEIEDSSVFEEVIELEDEDETRAQRSLRLEANKAFDKHVNSMKAVALRLKEMAKKNQCASRHRRALSTLVRTFNNAFNADLYIDSNYNIIDRKLITVDTSSESDEPQKVVTKKQKRLRNPFNILKRLNEQNKLENSSEKSNEELLEASAVNERVLKHFDKKWVPDVNDFGRPEICSNIIAKTRFLDSREDELLLDYYKHQQNTFKDWLDLKISFVNHIETSAIVSQEVDSLNKDIMMEFEKIKPIIGPEDSTDTETVLNKLRIIKTEKEIPEKTSLRIRFDVYKRNVANFRKTNLPTPHFRIVCMDASSSFPTGSELSALYAKYEDSVPIVFAVVKTGSISYVQINPTDLPVYIPNKDVA